MDCFTRQMERSDPLISIQIVARRLQKKKRAQTIPQAVLKLAKTIETQYEYVNRETVENDDDVILDDVDIGLED